MYFEISRVHAESIRAGFGPFSVFARSGSDRARIGLGLT